MSNKHFRLPPFCDRFRALRTKPATAEQAMKMKLANQGLGFGSAKCTVSFFYIHINASHFKIDHGGAMNYRDC